jgi:hypothetical protein
MIPDGDYSGEEFVGYIFAAVPERRHRLWFLDRHVGVLISRGDQGIRHRCQGLWSVTDDPQTGNDPMALTGVCLHYQHLGDRWYDERLDSQRWSAVWRLTDTVIPHVTIFGRDDDAWRLGLWPD